MIVSICDHTVYQLPTVRRQYDFLHVVTCHMCSTVGRCQYSVVSWRYHKYFGTILLDACISTVYSRMYDDMDPLKGTVNPDFSGPNHTRNYTLYTVYTIIQFTRTIRNPNSDASRICVVCVQLLSCNICWIAASLLCSPSTLQLYTV